MTNIILETKNLTKSYPLKLSKKREKGIGDSCAEG